MSSPGADHRSESPESRKRPASPAADDEPSKLAKTQSEEKAASAKEFAETSEMRELKVKLEHALGKLGQETRNSLLLQAVHHYTEVKKLRDDLLVHVGELDAPFADLILRKAREESGKSSD